ncbi:hypothetical protein TNCV_1078941, partial [Trichonephila clavipes]
LRCRPHHVAAVAEWYRYRTVALPCHEFEACTTKDPPCRAAMHVKSVKELKRPAVRCDVLVREGVPAQVSSTSLDHGSSTWSVAKSPREAEQRDVNIQSISRPRHLIEA